MNKLSLIAGLAAIALVPSFALAQTSCEQQRDNRVVGTVGGAVVGAVAGSAIAGRGHKGDGALVGGVLGGVIGNQATKPSSDCQHAYGYYDRDGAWHATNVEAANASGYYDRNGQWVDGAPTGYYGGNGQWMTAGNDRGYRDTSGRYVPGGVAGYYDTDGRYVTASHAQMMADNRRADSYGQYDRNGQWVASGATRGSATGYYDRNGQWVNGAPGGGYDASGRWDINASSAGQYSSDANYQGEGRGHHWTGAPGEISNREDMLEQRIRAGSQDGSLSRMTANRALRSLGMIRNEEASLTRRHRGLRPSDQNYLQGKLDSLSDMVRQARRDGRN